ncbi:MAG TPA: hypothetical protein VER04_00605 [Polyangiaceae bacterium]|nr:hypothetical protein [Polyangiaceae bacterium]
MGRLVTGLLGCSLWVGCGQGNAAAPLRSPSLDYAPPAPTTADGDTVGADRRAPDDKLHEGVTNEGLAPGWHAGKTGPTYDPKQHVGGAVDPPPANGSSKSK